MGERPTIDSLLGKRCDGIAIAAIAGALFEVFRSL